MPRTLYKRTVQSIGRARGVAEWKGEKEMGDTWDIGNEQKEERGTAGKEGPDRYTVRERERRKGRRGLFLPFLPQKVTVIQSAQANLADERARKLLALFSTEGQHSRGTFSSAFVASLGRLRHCPTRVVSTCTYVLAYV